MKKILIVDDIEGWRNYHSEILAKIFPDEFLQFSAALVKNINWNS